MARYARIFASIWSDPDFRALNAGPQRLYLLLVTQPDISHCGVLPLTINRWAQLAPDTDADSVRADLDDLQQSRFVLVDLSTEEALVRSHLKWDDQWRSPNGQKAINHSIGKVLSSDLRNACSLALATLRQAPPQGATGGDTSPQQPTTNNREPAANNQQPESRDNADPATVDNAATIDHPDLPDAIAALVDILYRAENGTVRVAKPWRASVSCAIRSDGRAAALNAHLNTGLTAEAAASNVAGLTTTRADGAHFSPGTGWIVPASQNGATR